MEDNVLLERGYYVGNKELLYGKLIGFSFICKLLLELKIKKLYLYTDKECLKKFLKF